MTVTVKELIEELKKCNPEFPVVLVTGLNGDPDEYELSFTDDDDNGKVRFECDELIDFMETIARPNLIEKDPSAHISQLLAQERIGN